VVESRPGEGWRMNARVLALGALAGVIGFLVGHQAMIELFYRFDLVTFSGWRTAPMGPFGVPAIVNGAFWCALWGMLMALLWPKLPGSTPALKGMLFGLILVQALGNWVLVPLFKGKPYFADLAWSWMAITACFQAAFGLVMGLAYGFLSRR
jgi:hypothetical protein